MLKFSSDADASVQGNLMSTQLCRNCGEPVQRNYCSNCGQHVANHNHGLWQFVAEFLEEFVRLDSKFLRTLLPLIVRPGFLTREWVAGRRIRYITPLKLYLTLSAICFLVVSTQHTKIIQVDNKPDKIPIKASVIGLDTEEKDSDWISNTIEDAIGSKSADPSARQKVFAEKLLDHLPTTNFILLPVFALLFKLLYARRSRYYVEHLVFALHYYAFAFLALTLCLLVHHPLVVIPVVLWLIAYMPIAMKVNYQQGTFKTLVKCALFGFMYLMAVSFVTLGLVVVTAMQVKQEAANEGIQRKSTTLPTTKNPGKSSLPVKS